MQAHDPTKSPPQTVSQIVARVQRPRRAVVTAGMPYANGPLHLGHLAGAHVPADIYTRWLGMLIGRQNVLFVNGTDDHGSTSELAALRANKPVREFIDDIHAQQAQTLARFGIDLDIYSGTSRADCFALQKELAVSFLRKLQDNGMLEKRSSRQWFDPTLNRFLADRFVRGICPNCGAPDAYGDQCDRCGQQHDPTDLGDPKSAVSDARPEQRETVHLYLNLWKVAETLRVWVESKEKSWRKNVLTLALTYLLPSLRIAAESEPVYKELKASLPKHKQRYARGKQIVLQFDSRADFEAGRRLLAERSVASEIVDEWAHRAITRDSPWGIPVSDVDPDLAGKTLYVWPDSLLAPISFTKLALAARGEDPEAYRDYWCDPSARVVQFLGQDNVFFYVLMQGALWLGSQNDPSLMPGQGDLQLTDVFGCFHLLVGGEKMSKSRGNFYTADDLLDRGYSADQIRYYLSILGLPDKPSDFDFAKLDERNAFLAGPMNAAFEKPISACHAKFGGRVPAGTLDEKAEKETIRIVQRYTSAMPRAHYTSLLFEIENYARLINSLFTRFKPHDDRRPERERADALYSSFYILKNLVIMLYPFAPATVDRVRESLRLPPEIFSVDQLGTGLEPGHEIGPKLPFFPQAPSAGAEVDG